jgi:drug/metabolite transporter (DMT)-like permease
LPRGAVVGGMLIGVAAVSTAAILSRVAMGPDPEVATAAAGAAPALAVALWRCAGGALALAPMAFRQRRRGAVALTATRWKQLGFSGIALGLHFALFQGSLALTTVASASTLATMSPIFVALGASRFLHEPATRRVLIGMLVTIVGAIVIGVGDLSGIELGVRALTGDVMAFGSAIAVAGYLLVGRVARSNVAVSVYGTVVYGVAAASLLVTCLALGVPLGGYRAATWLAILGVIVGPQLLGHTVFNTLLSHVPATSVSIVVLAEPVGAGLLAWWLLDELPAAAFAIGAPLVLLGVARAITGRRTPVASPDAPVASTTGDR